jgi:hypothetical protein
MVISRNGDIQKSENLIISESRNQESTECEIRRWRWRDGTTSATCSYLVKYSCIPLSPAEGIEGYTGSSTY